MTRVLFICVHNSGRSQMAEAFLNRLADGKAIAHSAGTRPAEIVNPTVVQAMAEAGIDISDRKPKGLTLEMVQSAERVITMGCGADPACPVTFVPAEDWQLEDPEGKPLETVRQIRDDIRRRVVGLLAGL